MDTKYETGQMVQKFLRKLKEREEAKEKGLPIQSESDFLNEFVLETTAKGADPKAFQKSYVANNYFEKNYEKYVKRDPNDNDPTKVFNPITENYENTLKVPFLPDSLDNFLTRYIYHNFARWFVRLGQMLGIKEE